MSLLKINKRPKEDAEETKDEDNELRKWFIETIKLPQYYDLFKKAGYEDIEYLNHFNIDNGDEELIEIGVKKQVHRRMILSKINARPTPIILNEKDELKYWFDKTLQLPQYYQLFRNAGYENIRYLYQFDLENGDTELKKIGIIKAIHRRMILSEIKKACSDKIDNYSSFGGTSDNKFVMVQHLNDQRKLELFNPPRRLLFGRTITIKSKDIKSTQFRLFKLKDLDDEKHKWDINDIVTPQENKKVDVHTSYSSLQQSLAKGSYINASVCKTR